MKNSRAYFLSLFTLLLLSFASAAPLNIQRLTCEYSENPLGIDAVHPRLGWTFSIVGRNQIQSAYEIEVSNQPDTKSPALWSTGKVSSNENTNIEYTGPALHSFSRYYWRVRAFDQNNSPSEWSSYAWFETAMLQQEDWKAKWIGDGSRQFVRDEDFYKDDPMPLFRKTVIVGKKVKQARLYLSGLGYYEAYLNENKIGDHVLDPGWTNYRKQVLYTTYDITSQIRNGTNVVGIMLGNGWYNPLPLRLFTRFNLRDVLQTGRPCVKAEIHLTYDDGTSETINTDETWSVAPGPIVRNNVYLGEQYDARLEIRDWLKVTSEKKNWHAAVGVDGPSGRLSAQQQPPIRVTKIIKPIRISEITPGVFLADMGQNFAGVARIHVKGKAGTKIKLRYGEALHPDGTLNFLTTTAGQIKELWHANGGPGAPATAWQEDNYVLKGEGTEEWAPRFTFHGFRYVEISGWPGTPSLASIEGLRMNTDLEASGEFSCSNDLFNQIHKAANWTFLSNVFSVQSDCPAREKLGYGADMVVTANALMYNFGMQNFYAKAVKDFANDQLDDGAITETAPFVGIADQGYGGKSAPLGWQLGFPYLQDQLYEFYGDKKIIEDNYPAVQRQIEFLKSHAIQGLYHWDIGDHETIDPKAEAFSASSFYYHHVALAAKFAGLLGRKQDSVRYSTLATQIKRDIVAKFYIPATGRFDNATQSAQVFSLWYDFTPDKEKTLNVLDQEFKRHNDHISSGIFGTKMMFDVLRQNDRSELAYRVANQKDYPGWGFMMAQGATTLWETWKYPDNAPSQNHPMFGSIDEWFYRALLGINSMEPGFRKIQIKPQPVGDLLWAKGSYESVKGKITSDWKRDGNQFTLHVVIPPNTRAEIWIPCKADDAIRESGQPITANGPEGIPGYKNGYFILTVGSGTYTFEAGRP
jgi:alpha-L-rhamnosidase